ncbi:carbohydrate-binding module family 48 protein [Trametes coccinea BRFM310]|uniref:Carbohydrate-binding module family 48 protein n=1 Tax=Trametes coccinea (strain BRFM310) TaxID=1353009 RepID=A0A1Y2J202_TRAC3|nr:carbohydrate-binding module family 48 protein [Trametes coccinea BRFM310]
MGNTSSNPSAANARFDSPSRHTHSPVRGGSPNPSASSTSHRVHRSLRHKKRSLELPDLASLTLTPASSSPAASVSPHPAHRRPRASSPIPIPTAANPPPQTFRPQNNLPSAARIDRMKDGASRYKSSLSAFNSTRSFQSAAVPDSPPRNDHPLRQEFVPEVVHSTIPIALVKAEEDAHKPEPVNYKITWRGSGKKVYLIRAGHDNWQGRQPMEYDPQTETFWTIVPLLPGTHHFKFIVDEQTRLTNDYPRAVDDRDGTLANYVAVTAPPKIGSPQQPSPTQQQQQHQQHQNSFWSDSSTQVGGPTGKGREAAWTTEIPPELIAAAAEEEAYLARADSPTSSASAIPAPNIPPAPALPRHLDKLILNVRPVMAGPALGGAPSTSGERDKRRSVRERERSRRDRGRDAAGRPANLLGMTAAAADAQAAEDANANTRSAPPPPLNLPVVTASGTDVTAMIAAQQSTGPPTPPLTQARPLDGPGLSDDASVLPVPSHVVLHHLSTSAIRNGVLAVANTTRYRKKRFEQYITTIYYKPT